MRPRLGIVAALLGTLACSGSASGGLPNLLLPDLDQRPPLAVSVRWGGPPKHHPLLVFTSSVENVGWGDIYIPAKEGQAIDISGVPPGDYDLVHRVNVGRVLREVDYSNDDSSMRIRLLPPPTPGGLPGVVVLNTCETGIQC